MKPVRYIVGAIGFILVGGMVAIVIGFIMALLFPPSDRFIVGVGMDWRNLPGTVLGLLAGIHSFRVSIREPVE